MDSNSTSTIIGCSLLAAAGGYGLGSLGRALTLAERACLAGTLAMGSLALLYGHRPQPSQTPRPAGDASTPPKPDTPVVADSDDASSATSTRPAVAVSFARDVDQRVRESVQQHFASQGVKMNDITDAPVRHLNDDISAVEKANVLIHFTLVQDSDRPADLTRRLGLEWPRFNTTEQTRDELLSINIHRNLLEKFKGNVVLFLVQQGANQEQMSDNLTAEKRLTPQQGVFSGFKLLNFSDDNRIWKVFGTTVLQQQEPLTPQEQGQLGTELNEILETAGVTVS
jgi:hypothetical protein